MKIRYLLSMLVGISLWGCSPHRDTTITNPPKELLYTHNISVTFSEIKTQWRIIQFDSSRSATIQRNGQTIAVLWQDQSINFSEMCRIDISEDENWLRLRRVFSRPAIGVQVYKEDLEGFYLKDVAKGNENLKRAYWGGYMGYYKTDGTKEITRVGKLDKPNDISLFGSYEKPDETSNLDGSNLRWIQLERL